MTKQEKHDLLVWMAEESGYYKPYKPGENDLSNTTEPPTPPFTDDGVSASLADEEKPIKPAFTDF